MLQNASHIEAATAPCSNPGLWLVAKSAQ